MTNCRRKQRNPHERQLAQGYPRPGARHHPVRKDTSCDRLLLDLINTKEFQRLRRIKQLGVSDLVFPGANHSRFAHSIGVMHTARAFLAKVRRVQPGLLVDESETVVLAASLIHDVGHGPFSHAFESVTGERHEVRTARDNPR